MHPLWGGVLLQMYVKSVLAMQLCRVYVKPLVAVGLCSGYNSLSFSFIFKQKCIFNLLQNVSLKFPIIYHANSFSSELCNPVLSEIKGSKTDDKFWTNM